ncbi:uncharacterized protein A1O9_05561 [Exophiala aquamarina CBS 119918]|uniref:Xylanolytic transcriptional activator regulatory domain-containing protein n=1 Tax=Exophiala aquamarina CBS 119918 TaxID=1182545 RepID=A0A072PEC7_9EURO|nr:uncharacterized protein A1O9_05561 [Exophiala aquamarina CBS 119918]KEF57643.1 hypothetical protein A1O9_05561 [Exophiala aquamarina CBS 119918]
MRKDHGLSREATSRTSRSQAGGLWGLSTLDIKQDGTFNDIYSCSPVDRATEITLDKIQCLPPLHETLPVIEAYFANVNSAMPLFHEGKFMTMVWQWYSESKVRQNSSNWAAINVVFALSLWHDLSRRTPDDDRLMCQCIRNAQTALHASTLTEHSLLDLQIVVGLAMLFQAGPNPRPTSILVAMAVRMAHRLRLHTKNQITQFDASTAWERDRVFWIVYVLDRDISLRLRDPYHQQDHDMDVDLPDFKSIDESGGIVFGNDGTTWINFLLCRIDLARIQAKAYDMMFSVQGEKLEGAQREAAGAEIALMLREWKESIPQQFQPGVLSAHSFAPSVRFLALLHFSYYHCLYLVRGIFSHDSGWIRRLTRYSDRYAVEHCGSNPDNDYLSPLPSNWFEGVHASRECMRLFHVVDSKDLALVGYAFLKTHLSL